MSKKIMRYRGVKSYSDVVKGPCVEDHHVDTALDEDEWGSSDPGEPVIKPELTGFRYSDTSSPISISSSRSVSPLKKNRQRSSKKSPSKRKFNESISKPSPIVISDTSEESPSYQKRRCVTRSPEVTRKDVAFQAKRTLFYPDSDSDSDSELPNIINVCRQKKACRKPDEFNTVTEDSNQLADEDLDFQTFYEDNEAMPVYKSLNSGIKTKDAVCLLLQNLPNSQLAGDIPSCINKNVSFVYSTNKIGHWKNSLCDGMGKWEQTGTETSYANVHGDISFINRSEASDLTLKITRRKYINGSCKSLHRIVILLEKTLSEDMLDQFYVQYYFDGPVEDIEICQHGNSKSNQAYLRTSETAKLRIQELCKRKVKPKDVVHTILEEQGGIEHVKTGAHIPKSRQQVSNFKKNIAKLSDPILECTDLAKEQAKSKEQFIRDIRSAPEFTMFMATKTQLQNVKKFCTQNKNFSVLGVDTTFNIGQYYVTVTTYRHLMLQTSKGVEPVMIGPMLLHQKKTFDSYFKLPSCMVQECPELKNVKVFGTDGDENLSNAFQVNFTNAQHLMCDIHMFDNIERKLHSLNIKGASANLYLHDIFGTVSGSIKVRGLVDCFSAKEFDEKLAALSPIWKERNPNGEEFLEYFIEYKSDIIKNCMSADLRSICGLGFPPKPYTQNANECLNSVIKKAIIPEKGQKLNPYDFVTKMEQVVKRQESEVKLSLIGRGEYKLKPEYANLGVKEAIYWKKTAAQRQALYKIFCQELLKTRFTADDDMTRCDSAGNTIVIPLEQTTDTHVRIPAEVMETDPATTSIPETVTRKRLYMTPESSGIISIPFPILCSMFRQAEELLEIDGNIVPVPGCSDKNLFIVANYSTPCSPYKLHVTSSARVLKALNFATTHLRLHKR